MALFLILSLISLVTSDTLNLSPLIPDKMDYHKQRVWLWLNPSPKCFPTQDTVLSFKDYLLTQYQCINYNTNRRKVHIHPTSKTTHVWSLWLDLHSNFYNFDCLSSNITLPKTISNACITNVYWEPLEHINKIRKKHKRKKDIKVKAADCAFQSTSDVEGDLWSLDLMDGVSDNLYKYIDYSDSSSNIEAIVLDTDVDAEHVEFSGITVTSLYTGNLGPLTSQNHGTHVSGTVVGRIVGGAKGTNLNYYPVCQLGGSCAWSDIEDGYETAIELMEANPSKIYVINYSVGGSKTALNAESYDRWGEKIEEAGSFWVTSAGNSQTDACNFAPAFTEYAVTVGSFSKNYVPTTWFTNYGECVDTFAPGDMIWSSTPGSSYGYSSGTSMASPNVCALVINLLNNDPTLSLKEIKTYLLDNAITLNNVPVNYGDASAGFWANDC